MTRKTLFLGLAGRSSSEIRGRQIAATNDNFFYNDQDRIDSSAVHHCDSVVFVRNFIPGLANQLRAMGKKVGFDLLDRPVADIHQKYKTNHSSPQIVWDDYCGLPCDFLIVNNNLTRRLLLDQHRDLSVHVIPHHTCNFESVENKPVEKVRTVGYIGLEDQLSHQKEIRTHLQALDVELVVTNPKTRSEVLEEHKKIDVGLIYLERGGYYENVLNFKPNTKLTNFQSFGIPTVACNYQSFLEFGNNAFLRVETLDDVFIALNKIVENRELRKDLRDSGLENAKKLSISSISKLYNF